MAIYNVIIHIIKCHKILLNSMFYSKFIIKYSIFVARFSNCWQITAVNHNHIQIIKRINC